jgi:hypothetical protein
MRKKLLMLSALTCLAGGSALLTSTPVSSQDRLPNCDFLGSGRCPELAVDHCTRGGQVYRMECVQGSWVVSDQPGW